MGQVRVIGRVPAWVRAGVMISVFMRFLCIFIRFRAVSVWPGSG